MVGSSPISFKGGPRWEEWNPSVHGNSVTSPAYITILLRNLTGDMYKKKDDGTLLDEDALHFPTVFPSRSFVLLVDLLYPRAPFIYYPPSLSSTAQINKQRSSQRKCSKFWPSGLGWMAWNIVKLPTAAPCFRGKWDVWETRVWNLQHNHVSGVSTSGFSHLHYLQ